MERSAEIEAPEVDRHLEQVIRELRAAENAWIPKMQASQAAHREWKRIEEIATEAREKCWALRKEAEQYLKAVGPR